MAAASPLVDVLVIGGGPSGLSVVTGLVRQLYTAVVFDSGVYRNERTSHMHILAGWDHRHPAEFRKAAREDILRRYDTIQFEDVAIEKVNKTNEGLFQATDANGKVWTGKKLVLATGVRDIYPDIAGYSDCWGYGIFHCLFCHGYEERGCASSGVLAVGDLAAVGPVLHMARMARRLTPIVTIYTDGSEELFQQIKVAMAGADLKLDARPIGRLIKGPNKSEVNIEFGDGSGTKTEGFLVHKPKTEVNGPFAQQLSLELTSLGDIKTSQPFYETSVPGVFAVGDCATPIKAVVQALATGNFGAAGLASQLHLAPPQ